MKMWNKVFCDFCLEFDDYEVVEKKIKFKDKKFNIKYDGKIAQCKKCQNEVYVDEIEEYNRRVVLDKIKKKMNL